jgi:hypothetical protein
MALALAYLLGLEAWYLIYLTSLTSQQSLADHGSWLALMIVDTTVECGIRYHPLIDQYLSIRDLYGR